MNIWKIAAGRQAALLEEFLQKQFISVSFGFHQNARDFSDMEELRGAMRAVHDEATEGQIIAWSSQLWRFYHDVQVGDIALVYAPSTRLYHVGHIQSDVTFDDGAEEHPHRRKVHWEHTLKRDALSTQTRNGLGAIMALFRVGDDAQEEILNLLQVGRESEPEVSEEVTTIEDLGEEMGEKAREFMKDTMMKLDWEQMQHLVAGLLRAMGYKTRVSAAGPDRGKDIIASPDGWGLEQPLIFVEVKHRQNTQIGAPDIRAFTSALRNAKGIYVSTGGFSREAHYEAERAEKSVVLVDSDELAERILQYYDQFDAEARSLLPLKKIYWPL